MSICVQLIMFCLPPHARNRPYDVACAPCDCIQAPQYPHSYAELCLGARRTSVGRVAVTHELNQLVVLDGEESLETATNLHQNGSALLGAPLRTASSLGTTLRRLAGRTGPQTDAVKGLADVDDNTHDLVVVVVLELFTNSAEKDAQPGLVVGLALLEGVGPSATVLVLNILPLGTYTTLE